MHLSFLGPLSQVLVAFTIELDNEFEHRMPHRTTRHGGNTGPWLTSFAMYCNCLRFLGEGPVTIGELRARARTATNVDGMRRWGYVSVSPPDGAKGTRPNDRWNIVMTQAGRAARSVWEPLPEVVETRWRSRFGDAPVSGLRSLLLQINSGLEVAYPDFLPILGHGLWTRGDGPGEERAMPPLQSETRMEHDSPWTAMLARVLCAFAYEFERESTISLAISANVLRVLREAELRNRDLPKLTGLSRESISAALGVLRKAGMLRAGTGLSARGLAAQEDARQLIVEIERRWERRFGERLIRELGGVLQGLTGDADGSRLLGGIRSYPGNWRAQVAKPSVLPWFPVVLHRGGFPDGS